MQLQVQILPADAGNPLGAAGGSGGSAFNLLTEDAELFLTEDGDELLQES